MTGELNSGDIIGERFVIERLAAQGGMGKVYRARDRHTGKLVAIKVIAVDHPSLPARLRLESRALLELNHPAIVRHVAHESVAARGLFLAMEWLDGVTLSDRIRGNPLSLDDTLAMAARVADGLGAAHARGMIHRDIKPLNLLLADGKPERVRILDFGIVRLSHHQEVTATGGAMGTPEYMAPEQARGARDLTPAADIFALGCVLYKCLTGRTAFRGNGINATLAKIAMVDHPPRVAELNPAIPRPVDDLVARMMAYDPAARPRDGSAAAKLLRSVRDAVRVGLDPTAQIVVSPAITEKELMPVSVIFAELEPDHAETLPSAVFDIDPLAPPPRARRPSLPGEPTDQHSFEHVRMLRGSSDAEKVLPAVRKAIARHGAHAEALLNGSIVARLSGGIAATDLAARAARCALAIRELLPDATIGVATQRAVADEAEAIGPIIDDAAALLRSRSRTIHIDASTRGLLPARFAVDGDRKTGYELRTEHQPLDTEEPPRRLLGMDTPCVGRGRVLRQLEAAFDGCAEDRASHAVVIVGEAGVGKSRLRAELMRRMRTERDGGAPAILTAWGDPVRANVPFGLIAASLRRYLDVPDGEPDARRAALCAAVARTVGEDDLTRVSEFLGELLGVRFDDADSPALRAARQDPELMSDQLIRAWQDWLVAQCRARPVLFVVDDLHWADTPSIDLISTAIDKVRDLPLLLLAFGRPEIGERFPNLADHWKRQEIQLQTLRDIACEELVRAALGTDVDPGVVARLVGRSAGNPFYLEELIRAAAVGETDRLPESVLASVQLRIGRQPDGARAVLRAASIFGRTFWPGGVAALLGGDTSQEQVQEWITALEWQELVQRRPMGSSIPGQTEYLFRHDLLREASYEMLTEADRRTGHRLAGQWLLDMGETEAIVLAEHFAGGGDTDQAIDWYERAAEQALDEQSEPDDAVALDKAATYYHKAGAMSAATFSNDQAITFFERAATYWAALSPGQAVRAYVDLAEIHERIGQHKIALEKLAHAEALASPDDNATRVEVLLRRANIEMRGDEGGALDRAKATAHQARSLASEVGNRQGEIQALAGLATILIHYETTEATTNAIRYAEMALSLQRESGDDVGASLWRLGNSFLRQNNLERAKSLYTDALVAAEQSGDEALAANCLINLGMVHFREWELDSAIQLTEKALRLHERTGHRERTNFARLNLGTFQQMHGDFASARLLLERALNEAHGAWIVTTSCQESLAELERCEGNERAAQSHLRAAATMCEQVGANQKEAFFLGLLAESLWSTGDLDTAIAALERAVESAEGVTLSHALLMIRMGEYETADGWLDRFRRSDPDPDRRVAAKLALARLRWWQRDIPEASKLCDEALGFLLPTRVARFYLPAQALLCCINHDADGALSLLEDAQRACAPHVVAELAVDIGETLLRSPDRKSVADYLRASEDICDAGLRYRLLDIRASLYSRLKLHELERESLDAARLHAQALECRLPPDYREQFRAHPWVRQLYEPNLLP